MASMKEVVIEKAEKMAAFLKDAENFPSVKAFRAEQAAATLATRQDVAAKAEVLRKEREEGIPKMIEDRDAKEAKYKEAKAALDTAVIEYHKAKVALSSKSYSFDSAIGRYEGILFETADPAIDEAITFFRDRLDWLREPGRISHVPRGGERNIFTEKVKLTAESNIEAIKSALQYCMAAIKEFEGMKLAPALDLQKIETLKKGIPPIDVYTEYTGEKPIPDSVVYNPLHLLPSASQTDWEIGKLKEKVNKLLRR